MKAGASVRASRETQEPVPALLLPWATGGSEGGGGVSASRLAQEAAHSRGPALSAGLMDSCSPNPPHGVAQGGLTGRATHGSVQRWLQGGWASGGQGWGVEHWRMGAWRRVSGCSGRQGSGRAGR